ncbi:MAG: hypothetical protein ACREND_09970, partial [Gemmatimonadaceae bacterium]
MRSRTIVVARATIAGAAAVALGACGGSSNGTTGPNGGVPPAAVQQTLASTIASSVSAQIEAMTSTGASPFLVLFDREPGLSTGLATRLGSTNPLGVHPLQFTQNCPEISPLPFVDSDGDGVPDSVSEVYTTDNCTESSNGTLSLSGAFVIKDPKPNTADLDYHADIGNFVVTENGPAGNEQFDLTLGLGGTLDIAETIGSITESGNYYIAVNETQPQQMRDSVAANLTATYTFPAEALLVEGDALPGGAFSANGNESFTINGTTYSFTLATTTPLTVNPECATGVTAGGMTLTFGNSGAVTITWSSCG